MEKGEDTLLETCHQVFFRKTLLFSTENEFLLPECQFEMEKQIKFTRAFFAFPGFSKKKNIKITPFSFHLCILAIFKARALKFWLQVALKIDPKIGYIDNWVISKRAKSTYL